MRIFFTAYEQANVPCIAPVMRALSQRDGWEPVFVPGLDFKEHRGCLAHATGPAGVPLSRLGDWLVPSEVEQAGQRGRILREHVVRWASACAGAATFETRIVATSLKGLLERSYMPSLFEAYARYELALEAFARKERPKLVVLPEDTDYLRGRLAARVFNGHGVPVVCLVPFYYNVFLSYPLLGERYAARYLVMNRSYADRLARHGVASDRIDVVGNPAFDTLRQESESPQGSPTFLYAMQGLPWESEIVSDLVAIFRDLPQAELAIKPHPELCRPTWLASLSTTRNIHVLAPDADAHILLQQATCVIGQSSSMLYQASVLGRAVIVPHYDPAPLSVYLPESDRSQVLARTKADLRHKIESILAGRGRGLAREEIAPFYPKSTERVVDCLESVRAQLSPRRGD